MPEYDLRNDCGAGSAGTEKDNWLFQVFHNYNLKDFAMPKSRHGKIY